MATYQILYWQEIPSQIKAEDELDDVTLPLDPRFMERIDRLAAQRGLQSTDDYLAQWRWSDEQEREGTAEEVARGWPTRAYRAACAGAFAPSRVPARRAIAPAQRADAARIHANARAWLRRAPALPTG